MKLFRLVLYATENISGTPDEYRQLSEILEKNSLNMEQLWEIITPDCLTKIVRCKWKGRYERCSNIFKKVQTGQGICCSFNEYSLKEIVHKR